MSESNPVLLLLDDWKARAESGKTDGFAAALETPAEIKQLEGDEFSQQWIISTGQQDRHGDIVEPSGWDFSDYLRGGEGVVLYGHNRGDTWGGEAPLPVAKCPSVYVVGDGVVADARFPRPEEAGVSDGQPYFANSVRSLAAAGFLKNASVGFIPEEWTFDEELNGYRFKKQTLLEWSIVPVPANPGCHRLSKADLETADPVVEYAQRTLDALHGDAGYFLTRERMEKILRAAGWEPKKTITLPVVDAKELQEADGPTLDHLAKALVPILASATFGEATSEGKDAEATGDDGEEADGQGVPAEASSPPSLTAALDESGLEIEDLIAAAKAHKLTAGGDENSSDDSEESEDVALHLAEGDDLDLPINRKDLTAAVVDAVRDQLNQQTPDNGKVY